MSIFKFPKKKKKTHGFAEKTRAREEIAQEYNHHAMMYGHISRTMHQDQLVMDRNQELLNEHLDAMVRLNKEAEKLPPPAKAETQPATTAETATNG